jgi:hypothetical protein
LVECDECDTSPSHREQPSLMADGEAIEKIREEIANIRKNIASMARRR